MRTALPLAGERAAEAVPARIVPLEHFAAAFVWLVAAAVGLVRAGPFIAAGAYSALPVLVVVHMLTLGVVLTVITGALQQIAPVAMGVRARHAALAHTAFALLVMGTLGVVLGMGNWSGALLGMGWTCVALAVAITWYNLIAPLAHATRGHNAARAVRVGFACLAGALTIAGARIGNVLGWWSVPQHALLVAHVHLALGGFATVIAMGVGSHVLPGLMTVRLTRVWASNLAWRATALGAVGTAGGALFDVTAVLVAGAAAFTVGVVSWLIFVGTCFLRRGTRRPDSAVVLIAVAHVMLACTLATGLLLFRWNNPRLATAYGLCGLAGWLTLFICGAASRIVPTLMRRR